MTSAKAFRLLLGILAIYLVVWAFYDVGRRLVKARADEANRPVVLTLLHWGNVAEDAILTNMCNHYMHDHPTVQVVHINAGDFPSKIKTMLSAGTPPDLFYLPPDLMPELASLKLIQPVDSYIAEEKASGKGQWLDDFFPVLLDGFRYDTASDRVGTGPLYGLPKDFTTSVFYVNLDLFAAAAIPVPYQGWTWNQFEDACRKITALNGKPEFGGRKIYGGFLSLWPDSLRNMIWTFGGDFFGPAGFRDVTLDSPACQQAMDLICRVRLRDKTVYNPTGVAKEGGQEFINGNIGSIGPIGRWQVPTYKSITGFKWDVVPVPCQRKEFQASQFYRTAWSMSATTGHPRECWELMKFLSGPEGAIMQSRLGLAIPPLKSVAFSDDFLAPPGLPPMHARVFLDAIPYMRIGQSPRQAEWGRFVGDDITRSIQLGLEEPSVTARRIKQRWLTELDSPLRRRQWKTMNWSSIFALLLAASVTLLVILWVRIRRENIGRLDRAQQRAGWSFISPWLIGFMSLTLGPMVISLLLSFASWTGMTPMSDAQSVGTANYRQLFVADGAFYQSLKVTLYYVILAVPIGQIAALAVAMLMNSRVRGIEVFRTIYFLPAVISGVALSVLWLQIFNNDYGLLNHILNSVLWIFHSGAPDWFGKDAARWAIPAFVIMSLWGVGSAMILYLAGLKGIPTSLYEAATIDGAGPMRRLWNVTLPMLSPLIFYNLIMGIIGSFQVFTPAYVMTSGQPDNTSLFYVLQLYREAFEFHNMGYASAMAWVLFVIVLLLTALIFRGSRKLVYYEGLKA